MEKKVEKKKENIVVKENKDSKPIVKKTVKSEVKKGNKTTISNDVNKIIRLVAYLSAFFATIFAIIIFVFGLITAISVCNSSPSDLVHNRFAVTFISKLSNSTIEETKIAILSADSKTVYVILKVVLPAIILVCAAILLIILAYLLLKFFNNVKTERNIFSKEKIKQLEIIINVFSVIICILWALFDNPSFPFVLIIILLLLTVYYLFKKCIDLYNK